MQHKILLGAHMSIGGGIDKSVDSGASIGCTTIQIFTKSNRQWAGRTLPLDEVNAFKEKIKETGIIPVAHATYLINIASADTEIQKKSVHALSLELKNCQELDIPYLVLHPGSCVDADKDECIARVAHNLDTVLEAHPGKTMILLENMAGQGSVLGSRFEELKEIYRQSHHKSRIGFCLDTCHAHAAGYDLSTQKAYHETIREIDRIVGIDHIKVIHLNDSKKELGSRVDRHEEIGKGTMGLDAFEYIMNDPHFRDVPKILETPNDDLADYEKNMKILKRLVKMRAK